MSEIDPAGVDVLVLVGGEGKRLREISKGTPKPLVRLNDQPFLSILLNYLHTFGFKRVVLCAGYKAEELERYADSEKFHGMQVLLSIESEPLGTAGAVKNAAGLINSENFVLLNGDTFLELDYEDFIKSFSEKDAVAMLALNRADDHSAYGSVRIGDDDKIVDYMEKTTNDIPGDHISAGVYMFNRIVVDSIPGNVASSLEYDLMPLIMNKFKDKIFGYPCSGDFIDIGTPKNFIRAQSLLEKYQNG